MFVSVQMGYLTRKRNGDNSLSALSRLNLCVVVSP
ncbi:unnamed protein product [Brassica oleracea var. botrytis]